MNIIQAQNISKTYGERELFHDLSFGINQGEKIALVAANGKGKSTLLRILTGKEMPDAGKVTMHNDLRCAFLEQNPPFNPESAIIDSLYDDDSSIVKAIKTYYQTLKAVEHNSSPVAQRELEEATQKMDQEKAWDYEQRMREMLNRLGIVDLAMKMGQLSGGQRKKVALAKTLMHDSDLLILDEPTNHLDISLIRWLEEYLSRQKLAILLVTHDRYFLDHVCDSILEISDDGLYTYHGKFDYFLEKRQERIENKAVEIEKAQNTYRRELEWIRRSPKARTTKSKKRIENFDQVKGKAEQRIESDHPSDFAVSAQRLGKKIVEFKNVGMSYQEKCLIKDFSYIFKKNERIGVVGPNGVGKSTLLDILVGKIKPVQGEIVIGETVKIGYYTQEGFSFKEDERLIDLALEVAQVVNFGKYTMSASQFLMHFGFDYTSQYNYFENLSGGEKRRFHLMITLLRNPNFLILDEPTNDLDVYTLNVLENFLDKYPGCLLLVSHDRRFLDGLADHIFAFRGDGLIKDYPGNYSQYEQWEADIEAEKKKKDSEVKKSKLKEERQKNRPQLKMTYKEKRELEDLEREIEDLSARKKQVLMELDLESSGEKITALSVEYEGIMAQLEEKEMRWIELSEKMEE